MSAAWPACRSGRCPLNDEVAVDLAWKFLKATEADLGPKAIDERQKTLLQEMVESAAATVARTARVFTIIRRTA